MSNKYQHLNKAQASIDFHHCGPLTKQQIIQITEDFIDDSQAQNFHTIELIVGQGLHSSNGPVIKPLLKEYLQNHPAVASVTSGKYALGGQGVLLVKLK